MEYKAVGTYYNDHSTCWSPPDSQICDAQSMPRGPTGKVTTCYEETNCTGCGTQSASYVPACLIQTVSHAQHESFFLVVARVYSVRLLTTDIVLCMFHHTCNQIKYCTVRAYLHGWCLCLGLCVCDGIITYTESHICYR